MSNSHECMGVNGKFIKRDYKSHENLYQYYKLHKILV